MEENNNLENTENLDTSESVQELPKINRGSVQNIAGNGFQATGKTMKTVGNGMEYGGKASKYAGKGINATGNGISSLGSAASAIPYVGTVLGGGLKALGGVTSALGKGVETLGNATEKAGKATNKAGDTVDKTRKNVKGVGKTPISDSEDKKFMKIFAILSSSGCLSFFFIFFVLFVGILLLLGLIKGTPIDGSGSVSYAQDCSNFTISSTSLSKDAFKTKLEEYANSTGNSTHQLFAQNANNIYDIATSENINPELVVVRAVSEGFDPGTGYNYWGIGCTNTGGGRDCKSYGSFAEGVKGFIGIVSKYSSLQAMMTKYAYIGKFWYNPGGSGVGGCYYASYIYPDGMPDRVANACDSSKNGTCTTSNTGSCVATTDEDQAAYANWQVKQMATHRKTVFGLEYDDSTCSSSSNVSVDNASLMALSDADAWILLTGYSSQSAANSISKSDMDSRVETIEVPIRVWASSDSNDYSTKKQMKKITVNKALSGLFMSFFTDLYNEATEFVINPSECYCYNYRKATNQTRLSAHAFGSACDLNWSNTGNGYKAHVYTKEEWKALSKSKSKYQILYKDSKMAEIMHRYTLSWGGEWRSVTDAMHFSFVGDDSRASLQKK